MITPEFLRNISFDKVDWVTHVVTSPYMYDLFFEHAKLPEKPSDFFTAVCFGVELVKDRRLTKNQYIPVRKSQMEMLKSHASVASSLGNHLTWLDVLFMLKDASTIDTIHEPLLGK